MCTPPATKWRTVEVSGARTVVPAGGPREDYGASLQFRLWRHIATLSNRVILRILKLIAVAVGVGGAMLLTLELRIRFLHLVSDNAPITYVAIPGDGGYSPAPGAEGRSMFGIVHRINTLGLRDRERATEKPAGTYRVVVVGDFVVYAHGVAQEEGLVAQLERLLQSRGHYDVWNLGVGLVLKSGLAEAYPKRRYWQGRSFAARRVIQPECPPRILCLLFMPPAGFLSFAALGATPN